MAFTNQLSSFTFTIIGRSCDAHWNITSMAALTANVEVAELNANGSIRLDGELLTTLRYAALEIGCSDRDTMDGQWRGARRPPVNAPSLIVYCACRVRCVAEGYKAVINVLFSSSEARGAGRNTRAPPKAVLTPPSDFTGWQVTTWGTPPR